VQRVKYNCDHGYNAWKFFVVVTPDGFITYLSHVMGGSESDKTHFNESTAPQLLEEKYGNEEGGEWFVLGGEKAYQGMKRPVGWKNMVTKSAEKEERKERREREEREERGEEVEGENDGPVEGGEDDGIMRVKSNKEWWGVYEKNAKIAQYCSTVYC
jgi:hypothetical protein